MDYIDLLKRAWNITWRYKALWVLGLFAGAMSGSSGGSSGSGYSESGQEFSGSLDQAASWAADNAILLAAVVAVLFIISVGMWILSIAAQGGIAHGTNVAAEGREPALRDSWSAGFAKWGRTFMVQFVLGLPVVLVALVIAGLVVSAILAGGDSAAGIGAICLFFPVLLAVIIAASVIIGILLPVAVRYGVLLDVTYGQAIKRAWEDLWGKKGLFTFWLVMLLPGIAYGFAVFVVAMLALIPAGVAIFAAQYYVAVALGMLMVLLLMLPNAIYATFVHAAWTLMFRHLTGMEQPAGAVASTLAGEPAPAPYAPPVQSYTDEAPVPDTGDAPTPYAPPPVPPGSDG